MKNLLVYKKCQLTSGYKNTVNRAFKKLLLTGCVNAIKDALKNILRFSASKMEQFMAFEKMAYTTLRIEQVKLEKYRAYQTMI